MLLRLIENKKKGEMVTKAQSFGLQNYPDCRRTLVLSEKNLSHKNSLVLNFPISNFNNLPPLSISIKKWLEMI